MIKKYALVVVCFYDKIQIILPERLYDTYEEAEAGLEKLMSANNYMAYSIIPYYTKQTT